ncbi:PREDICTED: fringe glycosyltransferase-like [Priapulus caudatus]|uniref:Fringe glycosyltransferase-like n=1 Tax=Priapulus caudatus TaxID=37621 RepID=A0ABM1F1F0_PRICU|nr:PREDICTED: fringe glycosyltransferase-like [Priapulus caudatus]
MWLRQRTSRAAQALALLSSAALLWCLVQQRGNVGSAVADNSNSALSPNSVADADVLLAADDFYPRFRQFKLQENNAARADGDDRRDDEQHLAVKPAVATTAADVSRVASDVKPWQRIAGLETIFLSVKTTGRYHRQRLGIILDTWFTLADEQTYFFTDEDDVEVNEKARGHLINTNCSASHLPRDLCCKMSAEYDAFMESEKKWFCHFDDDNYVNVASLARFLSRMDPREDLYLGRPSLSRKLDLGSWRREDRASFWFATGGAGFCLSRSLALKMRPYARASTEARIPDRRFTKLPLHLEQA